MALESVPATNLSYTPVGGDPRWEPSEAELQLPANEADWRKSTLAQTIYKIVVLAPKYICCGIGWTLGFAYGGNVGAGAGAAAGALVGSLISFLLIELIVGRLLGFDSTLQESDITALAIDRLKSAAILAAGCFMAGLTFNFFASELPAMMGASSPYLAFFTTMTGAALTYTAGATAARFLGYGYNYICDYEEIDYDTVLNNLVSDLQTGICLIGPADGMFAALGPPLLAHGAKLLSRHTWEVLWLSGRAVLAGGTAGVLLDQGMKKNNERVVAEYIPVTFPSEKRAELVHEQGVPASVAQPAALPQADDLERAEPVHAQAVLASVAQPAALQQNGDEVVDADDTSSEREESVSDLSDLPPLRALNGPCTCEECMPPAESDSDDDVEGVNDAQPQSRAEMRRAQLAEHFRRREQRAQLRRQQERDAVIPA